MTATDDGATGSVGMPDLDALATREEYMAAVRQCFRESGLTYRAVVRRLEALRAAGPERYQPRKENTFQDLVSKGAMPKIWVDDQGLGTLPQLLLALGYDAEQRQRWKRAWARIEAGSGPRNPAPAVAAAVAPAADPFADPTQPSQPPQPPQPPAAVASSSRRSHGPRRWTLAAVALIVTAAAGTVVGTMQDGSGGDPQEWHMQTPDTPGQRDGQCIGITDGRFAFGSPNLIVLGLLAALHRQNVIAMADPHIDVALNVTLTDPATPCAPSPAPVAQAGGRGPDCAQGAGTRIPADSLAHSSENVTAAYTELRGALMAQCEYNNAEGHKPKLRILIANAGSAYQFAGELAQRETELADHDPLFAAALGLYQSRQSTFQAEQILDAHHVPVVVSAASADGITVSPADGSKPFDALARLAATNDRETARIVAFLTGDLKASRPCLIGSTTGTDTFTTNWTADLRAHWRATHGSEIPTTTYDASSPNDDVNAELAINPGACGKPGAAGRYNAIVFSGRAQDLQYVLQALRTWNYPPGVPVIGGDDLSNLVANPEPTMIGDSDDRSIYFADFGFTAPQHRGDPYYLEEFADSYPRVLGPENIATGHLYTAFNALWLLGKSAATVNAQTAGHGITVGGQQMRDNISSRIRATCGPTAVLGASGMISFDANGDPMRGLIVINRMDSTGKASPSGFDDTTDGVPGSAALKDTMTRQKLQCQQTR